VRARTSATTIVENCTRSRNELESLRYDVVGGRPVDAETVAAETAQREDELQAMTPVGLATTQEPVSEDSRFEAIAASRRSACCRPDA
jgi:hypothetical protein